MVLLVVEKGKIEGEEGSREGLERGGVIGCESEWNRILGF